MIGNDRSFVLNTDELSVVESANDCIFETAANGRSLVPNIDEFAVVASANGRSLVPNTDEFSVIASANGRSLVPNSDALAAGASENDRSLALVRRSNRLNLVRATIEALPVPMKGRAYYSDNRIGGLQLVVTANATKTWYLYRRTGPLHKPKRHFLGRYPDLSPDQARRKAEQWRGAIAGGADPSAMRQTERVRGVTLGDAFKAFCQVRGHRLKPRTLQDYRRFLEPPQPGGKAPLGDWRDRPVVSITKDLVGARHRALTAERGEAQADLAMRFLRSVINFARFQYEADDGTPLVVENPVLRLSQTKAWNRPKRRSSYIKPHELRAWFAGVEQLRANGEGTQGALVADYLELLILTGLRRSEGMQLRRADVDLKDQTLTVRDPKNREEHTLPLSDRLVEILGRRLGQADGALTDYIFPGDGPRGHLVEPRPQMLKVMGSSAVIFALHDLRRTFATVAEGLDISAYALKRLLNHKVRSDVTAGYVIVQIDRLRKPMQRITDFMLGHAGLSPRAKLAPTLERSRQWVPTQTV